MCSCINMAPVSLGDSQLAHDLSNDVWRSGDIAFGSHQAGHVEIITPGQLISSSNSSNSQSDGYIRQTANSTFSSIKINSQIVEDLKRCGFVRPSPIQATSIPLGRIGIDLIAQSKSGTGKTIVFVVCSLEMIIECLHEPPSPRVLIVAPTREIAIQIGSIIDSLTNGWPNFSCYKAIGGTKVSENISQLAISQIIVGTPGRICCLLELDFLKPNSIRLLVLDECDKLMEESFKRQIDKLYSYLPANKQMIVTSATLSDEMTLFLANYMRSPALVRLNADNPALMGVIQMYHRTEGHSLDYLNFEAKIKPLLSILGDISFSQCVIFSNYQTRAKYLFDQLVASKWTVMHISGDMTQRERLEAINAFRRHKCRILVSTDITSRGIDIDTVNLIINLDVPIDSETYLHRIGRAGRFGSAGIAITLIGNDTDFCKFKGILDEYHLEVNELTLPIKVNPWNSFYQDQLDSSRATLQKRWCEGLRVCDLFSHIIENISQVALKKSNSQEANSLGPFDFHADNELAQYLVPSLSSCNLNVNRSRSFLSSLLTSDSSQINVSKINEVNFLNDESTRESVIFESDAKEIESQSNISIEKLHESEESKVNSGVSSTMSEGEEQLCEERLEWQAHDEVSIGTEGCPTRDLFKRAFLRPPITARGHFPSTMSLNVVKYLLKGGTHPLG